MQKLISYFPSIFEPKFVQTKRNRLSKGLFYLLGRQLIEFLPYYLGAFLCLYFTHYFQVKLPFMASNLATIAEKGKMHEVELMPFFWVAISILVFRTLSRILFFQPARVQEKFLRIESLELLESSHPSRYKDFSAGQIFQTLFNDFAQIRALVGFALLQVGNMTIALIVILPQLRKYNAELMWALLPMAISLFIFSIIMLFAQKYFLKSMNLQGEMQNLLIETYNGKKSIKNFQAEDAFYAWFETVSWAELLNFYKAGIGRSLAVPLIPLGMIISILWGALIALNNNLGAPGLVLFSGLLYLLQEPLLFLSWIGVVFSRSSASWSRIKNLLNDLTASSKFEKKLSKLNPEFTKELALPFWDEEIKITIPENKWTVLIGETGHGKTWVLEALASLFYSNKKQIALVAQEPYLYNDSIERNIFLGKTPTATELEQALELMHLFDLSVLCEDGTLNLEVGENGKKISGGQAKRLVLVRSILSDVEYLFWDDPFSSVDLILEHQILAQLKKSNLLANKTLVLTSHRLTTVKECDYIVFLDKESGIKVADTSINLLGNQSSVEEYFAKQRL